MFMTILVTAGTLLQAYVFWRAASVPMIKRCVPRWVLVALGVALWAGLFLSFYLGHGGSGAVARVLELFGMTWLAVLFLAFVALLVTDVITGFGFLLPRLAPRLRGWALLAACVLSVFALVQGMRPPVVRDYQVRLVGLPANLDGTVLVALSDLHLGSLLGERWLAARVAQVRALRPDIVVLLGDLLEGHGQAEGDLLADFRRLSAPLGVWAVTGNHESHGGRSTSARLLEATGFQVLHDRWAEVRPGLILAGVDDLTSRRRAGLGGDPIREALAGRPPGATILLSHTPWEAEKAAAAGAGLMLCGHTHGGQIWPFDYLTRTVYPLLGGRYEVEGMPVIVCRGTGTWGPRMRLWRPSEILRVTLRTGPAAGLRPPNR
jgi:predicted MPP superfamily phosphohydrolase